MSKSFRVICLFCVLLSLIACSGLYRIFNNVKESDDSAIDDTTSETVVDWSTVTISCFGDSLTAGGYTKDLVTYPQTLRKQLKTFACINYGKGSSTACVTNNCPCHPDVINAHNAGCLRYTQITKASDIIIVMFGANDSAYAELGSGVDDTNINTFYGGLNKLCSGLKENYPNAWVFFMTNFNWSFTVNKNTFGALRGDYFSAPIKEVCGKYGIDVFDTFNELNFDASNDVVDGIHVTQNFIDNVWVPAIAQYIKANYKQK